MSKQTLNLFFGILLSISSGSTMIYPIYSYYIKTKFNFSLRSINLYATFINIGIWVAFGMGIVYDSLGPTISNIISLILLPVGYLILYKMIQSSSVSLFWFLLIALIIGQGGALAYTNSLSTNVKNFSKKNSSNIVGLIISNCAIAPSIFTSVKTSFSSMSINAYIIFVICYIAVIIVLCFFWFDVIKQKRMNDLENKLFNEYKEKFIIFIFGYSNFISLIIFICILLFNHTFGVEIPAFIVFIIVHILYIVFIIMEINNYFDNWLRNRFNRTHQGKNDNLGVYPFKVGGMSNEVMVNNKNLENNISNTNKDMNKNINKKGKEGNEDNKRYTDRENISKIKNKFDFDYNKNNDKDNNNKNDYTLDIKVNNNIIRKSLESNQNINNIAETNKDINERISIESKSNNEEVKDKEDKNMKEEDNNEEKKNNDNTDLSNENNIISIDEKKEDLNLENNNNNTNNQQIKEDDDINDKNKEGLDNEEKKNQSDNENNNNEDNDKNCINENDNSKVEEKTEKIDDTVNYPKFSINSSNNNNEERVNVDNNYPKFSLTSDKTEENPYKEKEEKPKFSIINKEEEKKDENKNNFEDNKIKNKEEKEINEKERNKNIFDKSPILPPNKTNSNYPEAKGDFNYLVFNTNTYFNNDNNLTNNSILQMNNKTSIFELENEKEDDNIENVSRCVFFLTLFRRPQIMLLFIVLALTMGCMISNVNNIKYIVISIDSSKSISSTSLDKYPLLYFAFNSLSRVATGRFCNELMGTDKAFVILISITTIGLVSQILGLFMSKFFIYLSISLAGMTHGGIMTFAPLYCRYYFSIKNLGTVLGFLTTGNAIGSILIATLIFPVFYHKYSVTDKNGEESCTKVTCFWFSYAINCLFVLVAIGLSYFIYVGDKNKKIRERKNKENMNKNLSTSNSNIASDNTN